MFLYNRLPVFFCNMAAARFVAGRCFLSDDLACEVCTLCADTYEIGSGREFFKADHSLIAGLHTAEGLATDHIAAHCHYGNVSHRLGSVEEDAPTVGRLL